MSAPLVDRRKAPRDEGAARGVPFGLAAAAVVWVACVVLPGPFLAVELAAQRAMVQLRGRARVQATPAVLVALDKEAYDHVQRAHGESAGGWSRARYAELITALRDLGARVIGVDLLLSQARATDPEGDARLAEVLSRRADVVLGAAASHSRSGANQVSLERPHPRFAAHARVGVLNLPLSPDGVVRRAHLTQGFGLGQALPSFELALVHALTGATAPALPDLDDAEVEGLDHPVHRGPDGSFLIHFEGGPGTTPVFSAATLLDPARRAGFLGSPRVDLAARGPVSVEASLHPPGEGRVRLSVTPASEEVEALVLPRGEGPWAAARGAGTLEVAGLGPGPHRVLVARPLGEAGSGVMSLEVEVRAGSPAHLEVSLPAPAGPLVGRAPGLAAGDRLRAFGDPTSLPGGTYAESFQVAVDAEGRFVSPPLVGEDFRLSRGGEDAFLSRGPEGEVRLPAGPGGEGGWPLPELEGLPPGVEVLLLDEAYPVPPFQPAPLARAVRPQGAVVQLLVRDGATGHSGRARVQEASPFEGAVVLIGDTSEVGQDLHLTPLGTGAVGEAFRTPGVDIHAQALRTLLAGRSTRTPTGLIAMGADATTAARWQAPLLLLLLAVGAAAGGLVMWAMPGWGLGAAGALALAWVLVAYQRLAAADTWLHVGAPLLVVAGTYVAVLAHNYASVERRRRRIRSAFQHYLDPDIVAKLMQNPEALALGGHQQEVTVFFSDIEGFSSFSEQMTPTELVQFINEYLTELSDVLLRYGGWVDKFIGDAIVCVFNAPRRQPDHALRCTMAALEVREKEVYLREKWRDRGLPEARTRIGVNTGDAVVGNVGTESRKNYTILGDAVNLAARLEALNKSYGTYLMIGEATYEQVKGQVEVRELDKVRVKGKTVPAAVYEVLALAGALDEVGVQRQARWAEALAAYRAQDWDAAQRGFEAARDLADGDGPSETYLKRITLLRSSPPGEGWDGVWTMEHK